MLEPYACHRLYSFLMLGCVRLCVCVCVRARVCVCACVRVRERVRACLLLGGGGVTWSGMAAAHMMR